MKLLFKLFSFINPFKKKILIRREFKPSGIEERLIRRNQEDVIEIGEALEKFYNGPAGTIVRAMANSITTRQFIALEDNLTSSDKKLGRAEGLMLLITDIELAIDDKNRLVMEFKEDQKLED